MLPLLLSIAASLPASGAAAGPAPVAIVGATVIDVSHDGRTAADLPDAVVVVRGGRIAAVGPRGRVRLPRGIRIVSAKGEFLIPGLIDGYGAMRNARFARAYLQEGVTTVVVPLGSSQALLDGEDKVERSADTPDVLTFAPLSGRATPPTRRSGGELRRAVDAAANAGRRGVVAGFDVDGGQLRAIVAQAHRRGLVVAAELAATTYSDAVDAGVDVFLRNDKYQAALSGPAAFAAYAGDPQGAGARPAMRALCGEELGPAIAAFGARLARSHTRLMPGLAMEATADDVGGANPWTSPAAAFVTLADLDDPVDPVTGARPYLAAHPDRREAIRSCALHKERHDGDLHRAGARYLAGSTAPGFGVMPGSGLHEEIKLLNHIGLTPREALAAATGAFADAYGWRDRGAVRPGTRADLVLLTADPRTDAGAIDHISAVMAEGRFVDRRPVSTRPPEAGAEAAP